MARKRRQLTGNAATAVAPVLLALLLLLPWPTVHAETMTMEQILQQVLVRYPSLKIATMEVEKARHNVAIVESGLGWMLSGSAGLARNTSLIGSPVTRVDAAGNMGRRLKSGDSVSVNAGIAREDAKTPFSPSLPNPVTTASIDLNYRKPLQRGKDNPDYTLGLAQADLGVALAGSRRQAGFDQLAQQVVDIYLAAIITLERIDNLSAAVDRTRRLDRFIRSRFNLGVAEDKDTLQVQAQLDSLLAQLKGLELAWTQQRIALNRLMGMEWNHDLQLPAPAEPVPEGTLQDFLDQGTAYSPRLAEIRTRINLADAAITARLDQNRDQLDVVSFIGSRSSIGDSAYGNADSNNWIGGVRVEYQGKMDRRGDDALLEQAALDRGIAVQDQRQALEDLHYDLAGLLAEIRGLQDTIDAYRRSVDSEKAKLAEADRRYRQGRADIDQLIMFENQLSATELALSLQRVELSRRLYRLALLRGEIWNRVRIPEASTDVAEESP